MIFTSNFKVAGHLPQSVAICRGLPKGWTGRVYRPLAPSWALIKAGLGEEDFIRTYRAEVLNRLDPQKVLQDLGGDDFVMLCWEPPGKPCHRRIVAVWLESNLGIKIPEFDLRLKAHQEWLRKIQEESQRP